MRTDTFSLLDVLGNKEIPRIIWPGLAEVKSSSLLALDFLHRSYTVLPHLVFHHILVSVLFKFLLELPQKEMKYPKTKN